MDQTSHPAAAAFCRRCNRLWRAGVKSRVLTFFKYLHDCELSRIILKMSIWANLALAAYLTAAMMSVLSAVACISVCWYVQVTHAGNTLDSGTRGVLVASFRFTSIWR